MTALAGIWRFDQNPDAAIRCRRMLLGQRAYGPDHQDQWSDGGIALGRALRRTLPEDKFDNQPFVGGEGRYVLVADVRLDNREELAAALGVPLARVAANCDAMLLLTAIERWGERCFEHLLGDYAFALWDGSRRKLTLARDPTGQRPLYYYRSTQFIAFASMPKGLHALAEIPRTLDEDRIAEWLIQLPAQGERTFFAGVNRVEPGQFIVASVDGNISLQQHWIPVRKTIHLKSQDEYAEALRGHLDQAVGCRLRGTGDVGAYMSGGYDSTAVAATAARLLSETNRRVIAYTAVPRRGYVGPAQSTCFTDESVHAASVAAMYPNMEHVLVYGDQNERYSLLSVLNLLQEEPLPNICNMGWYYGVRDRMRDRGLSVALVGDMGNLSFSFDGIELLPELIKTARFQAWWKQVRQLVGPDKMRWRGALAATFGPWCPTFLWMWLNKVATNAAPKISDWSPISPTRLRAMSERVGERLGDLHDRPWSDAYSMRVDRLSQYDPGARLKGDLARSGIDERDPTADVRLIEFSFNVPTDQYVNNGVRRALARHALADRLPANLLNESRSGLQAADWHERLTASRDEIKDSLERLNHDPVAARLLDLPRLRELVENWPADGWETDETTYRYRVALLRAISMGSFLRYASGTNY